jgi:hypothetical protein
MKITNEQLKQMIKEELETVLNENWGPSPFGTDIGPARSLAGGGNGYLVRDRHDHQAIPEYNAKYNNLEELIKAMAQNPDLDSEIRIFGVNGYATLGALKKKYNLD